LTKTRKLLFPKDRTNDMDKYLKRAISKNITKKKMLRKDEDDESEHLLIIRANNNTMKSEIKYAYRINFTKPHKIGSLLGTYTGAATMA